MRKKSVIFMLALALTFSPPLVGMVKAGELYFEGVKPVNYKYDQTSPAMRGGLTLRFSFGGPGDYSRKKNKSANEIYRTVNGLDSEQITAIGLGVVAVAVIVIIIASANKGARFG